ncbi:hypothetical protein [Amycolatopsis panacis]|uniref:Uncharacterized protein n=1 Tax=Amycolatopsis panacis TaxID=2340917 RepID=A0A419I743_9PSEU|nr:hypothetical protein [Amycolatopsis panacis]RJQ87490.1 hypothetical protein D5S19_09670 [Amycolatopsis panacis]
MNDHAVGWRIEAFRESDELVEWYSDLPPGTSHHVLERVLGVDDMSMPEGYPVTAEQVRAVLDYFDVPEGAAGPLDDARFAYFVAAFADTRTTKPASGPSSGGQTPP